MLQTLQLLLPALIPSWRFFQEVGPSPRIEYRFLQGAETTLWTEAVFKPEHVSVRQMLGRLLWNPDWNEYLFLMTCAERLADSPDAHWVDEINTRLARRLNIPFGAILQFRLVFVEREDTAFARSVEYVSTPLPMPEPGA